MEEQQNLENQQQQITLEQNKQQELPPKPKETIYQQKISQNYWRFVMTCICFAFFYVLGTYKIDTGLGVFVSSLGEMACCFAILKQWDITMKKNTLYYVIMIVLMNGLMLWTDQSFLHFWQKKIILLLFIVMMFHQMYTDTAWGFKTYIYNLFLLLFGGIASLFQPIEHFIQQMRKKENQNQKWLYVILGLGIALPFTLVIIAMLMSADSVFANMIVKLVGNLFYPPNIIAITFLFVLGYWIFYCFTASLARKELSATTKQTIQIEPIIAITFTSVLLIVYLLFCGIQIWYLFIGKGNLPEGYTYSSYARKGFFELLFVSVINFLMVIICNWKFRKHNILNMILTAVSVCNVIMIASSFYRMMLYVKAYHMTVLRVYVFWFLALLAVSMVGVVYAIYHKQYRLYQYLFVVGFIFMTILSAVKPEAFVAKYNLEHMKQYTTSDIRSIMFSSLDVVPELAKIDASKIVTEPDQPTGEEMMKNYFEKVIKECEQKTIRTYHIGIAQAEKSAKEYLKNH